MARQIVVLCDACGDQEQPGHLVTLSIDGTTAVGLDLCDIHDKELLDPLRQLIAQAGVPAARLQADQPRRRERKTPARSIGFTFTCPVCPEAQYTQLQSLGSHFLNTHSYDARGKQSLFTFGTVCPLCGTDTMGELGQGHLPRHHPEIQGGSAALFAAAENQGDKHKVVKRQREAVAKALRAAERAS